MLRIKLKLIRLKLSQGPRLTPKLLRTSLTTTLIALTLLLIASLFFCMRAESNRADMWKQIALEQHVLILESRESIKQVSSNYDRLNLHYRNMAALSVGREETVDD